MQLFRFCMCVAEYLHAYAFVNLVIGEPNFLVFCASNIAAFTKIVPAFFNLLYFTTKFMVNISLKNIK